MSKPDFEKKALDLTTYGHPFTTGDYDDFDICAVCRRDVRRHLGAGKTQAEEIESALREAFDLGQDMQARADNEIRSSRPGADDRAALMAVVEAAREVDWFDWSENDSDAIAAIARLHEALARLDGAK